MGCIKSFFTKWFTKIFKSSGQDVAIVSNSTDVAHRLDRLERNYIILLKRVLEIDGIQLVSKTGSFSAKIMSSPSDDLNKSLNDPDPTIH